MWDEAGSHHANPTETNSQCANIIVVMWDEAISQRANAVVAM